MTTMRERIATGKLFTDYCEGLPEDRAEAKRKMIAFNMTTPDSLEERFRLIKEIFSGEGNVWIEPPIYFCYGKNIEIGEDCYINFNCNFVDDGKIIIGNKVMFGPGVTVATVGHPINPKYRGYMYSFPVKIENNCWIGAGAIICPGVTIGENSVIGAGSVVTKDIPANVIAVGNPCKVLRIINEDDMKYYSKGREITQEDLDEEARLR
jgi:galactoside O-acetyltransferase